MSYFHPFFSGIKKMTKFSHKISISKNMTSLLCAYLKISSLVGITVTASNLYHLRNDKDGVKISFMKGLFYGTLFPLVPYSLLKSPMLLYSMSLDREIIDRSISSSITPNTIAYLHTYQNKGLILNYNSLNGIEFESI